MSGQLDDRTIRQAARNLAAAVAPVERALASVNSQSAGIDVMIRALSDATKINDLHIAQTSRLLASVDWSSLRPEYLPVVEANKALAAALRVAQSQIQIDPAVFAALSTFDAIPQRLKFDTSFASAFLKLENSRALAASLIAQDTLAELNRMPVGGLIGADSTFRRSTAAHMGRISRSYSALIDSSASPTSRGYLTTPVAAAIPVEYYRHVQAIRSVTIDTGSEFPSETVEAAVSATGASVDTMLARFDASLVGLLDGARQSVYGSNPDRPRHVTTSLRELITQTLHGLAPDDAVSAWSSDPKLYHNGRPTRGGRILYICRLIDGGPLGGFVKADVSAAIAFIESLNAGTHTVQSQLTDAQLRAQVARAESLLVFLLQLDQSSGSTS